ncbi:hypothetical protein [Pontibacter sp. H249]|uniref:hypothetical protein n=1 Tax=Pontibacter sp. H249 TaxID=3133420 RepID=UPI0030BF6EA4
MKIYLQIGLLSLFLVSFFSACERISGIGTATFAGVGTDKENTKDDSSKLKTDVQVALHKDAQLARGMPLKQYARYMKGRHAYYNGHTIQYQDDFVKITVKGNEMRIETGKGKVKMEHREEETAAAGAKAIKATNSRH